MEPRLSGSCLKFSWQKNKLPKAEWDAWGSSPPRRIYGALMATEITEGTILHRGGISVSPFINMGKFEIPLVLSPPLSGTQVLRVTS